MSKRIRKYNGSFIPATQNIADWNANEELRGKTSAIIKNSQYSFIFKLSAPDMKDVFDVYKAGDSFNDEEQRMIISAVTGQTFFVGSTELRSCVLIKAGEEGLYDIIVEIEEKIEDAKLRKKSVEAETLTMENIYKILQRFGDLYDLITEEERKQLISHLIQEIQIYPEGESECPLKSIKFNFPVYKDGKEVREVFLKSEHNVETLVCLERK